MENILYNINYSGKYFKILTNKLVIVENILVELF